MPTQLLHPTGDDESGELLIEKLIENLKFSDCDEPLLSGSGHVYQEHGEENLKIWTELIEIWKIATERLIYDLV